MHIFSRLQAGVAVLCLFALAGCASQPPLNTPTGRADITIPNADLEEVKNLLTTSAIEWGYYVKKVGDFTAVYEKREERVLAKALMGSQYDSTPVWRLTYNIMQYNDSTRIVANIHLVTNPGSAFERITDVSKNSDGARNIQAYFVQLKDYFAGVNLGAGRGKVGIGTNAEGEIVSVRAGSPAEEAGLKVGDRIIAVGGEPFRDNVAAVLKITGEPGTIVELQVERGGAIHAIDVMRGEP